MSNSRRIVIDDSDPGIQYIGHGWFGDLGTQDAVGNFGPTYLHTEHGTDANNSLAFAFAGSSITVYGTIALQKLQSGAYDPSWECFVDGQSIGAAQPFQYAENNWPLCDKSGLSPGSHLLTVNVTTMGATFWLDYLEFTPPPNISYGNGTNVLSVSNLDPGIQYGPGWGPLGSTANFTTKVGSQLMFNFTGTSLTWVAFIPTELSHNASSASYSIDGGPPTTFRLNGLPADATTTVYNQIFFTTPQLSPAPHSLLVTYLGNGSGTPLALSNFFFTNVSTQTSQSTNPTSTTPNHSSSSSTGPNYSSSKTGAIAGGVVGGILGVLVLLGIIIFLLSSRRRRKGQQEQRTNATDPNVTPFMSSSGLPSPPLRSSDSAAARFGATLPGHHHHRHHQNSDHLTSTKSNLSLVHSRTASGSTALPTHNGSSSVFTPTTVLPFTTPEDRETAGTTTATMTMTPSPVDAPIIHRHEDSGLRMTEAEGMVRLELPPAYTPR